ncbi:r3H domain-containing protein 4 [Trichonephila inaurata madagascariensis]|uniref:R3H domain-containing protein 4 n=1 Tax=Trichonephila inaurata madagascariensis TaxID=2747483 RepID=A0A8X7C2N9_9ARAC|nr:r3H domain-containing protein 4 [Trichonephila inaurata madagascariensis]
MGVIKKLTFSNTVSDSIEDVLEDIQNQEHEEVPEIRRPRKTKHRSPRPQAVGGIYLSNAKSGKKKKRVDNCNYLLSLADPEEVQELSIQDFIPKTESVFTQLYTNRDKIEIWNDFINCTQDNEEWFKRNSGGNEIKNDADLRSKHPAYLTTSCFQRINNDIRSLLKKKRVPLGALMYLEQELITFFVNRPTSIYHCQLESSFQRLMIHALSQYMDLSSLSYNRNGNRWTRVKNKHQDFYIPTILLSSYLENQHNNRTR